MKLKAIKREIVGKRLKTLRQDGIIPASVFGPNMDSINVQVNEKEFKKVFKDVGFNKFFDLEIDDDKAFKSIVKGVQVHPIKDFIYSVNLYKVNEKRKIEVEVPVEFLGVAPAEQTKVGFIVHQMDSIKVRCFPKDLPSGFQVDISKLEKPGDAVTVAEIALPEDVELDTSVNPSNAIVYVASFQKEEVEEVVAPVEGEEGAEAAAEGTTTAEGGEAEKKAE